MGGERSEIRSAPLDLERKRDALYFVLNSQGICLPYSPSLDTTPGRWVVRAERDVNRLKNPLENHFRPHDGQYGEFGVFLGDNLSCLMYPDRGIYWVFESRDISGSWLCVPSEEWQERYQQVIRENRLNPESFGDGFRAQQEIHEQHFVYNRETGVCTSPVALSPLAAAKVLITEGVLPESEMNRLPAEINEKLVVFKYE